MWTLLERRVYGSNLRLEILDASNGMQKNVANIYIQFYKKTFVDYIMTAVEMNILVNTFVLHVTREMKRKSKVKSLVSLIDVNDIPTKVSAHNIRKSSNYS